MRSSSHVKRPVASFNSGAMDSLLRSRSEGGENAEVLDDLSSFAGLKAESDFEAAGYANKEVASITNFGCKSFAGAWKPVIDGKVQPLDSPNNTGNVSWRRELSRTNASSVVLLPRGSEKPSVSTISGSSDVKKDEEGDSDSEIRKVPELPERKGKGRSHKPVGGSSSTRKRSASNDKEGKRLKRLLRNRVSAQQARERKKAYLGELEQKAKDLETRCGELEEKNATLQRENYMLRQIVKNTTAGRGDSQ